MQGKLQTFYCTNYWFTATLRRNKTGEFHPFTLRVRDERNGRLLFCGGYSSAIEAKRFLERYGGPDARWYTEKGMVED